MTKYLDNILKVLPAVQAKQISDLLEDFKQTGEITSAEEYRNKLQEFSALLSSEIPKPSFELINAIVFSLCSSYQHNRMFSAFQNDIETIFLQVDEISKILNDHHVLFTQNLFPDLNKNIIKQQNQLKKLEWLSNNNNEYTNILVNNFSSTSLENTPISDVESDKLYYDNRTFKTISEVEIPLARVSPQGSKLILDTTADSKGEILPISVEEFSDSNSYSSLISVDYNSNINNIIDGRIGTYWTRTVYLKEQVEKVSTVLSFNVNNKYINYIIFESGTEQPCTIEKIEGVTSDGIRINLVSQSQTLNGKLRIDFTRQFLSTVIVTFSVKTYKKDQFFSTGEEKILDIFEEKNTFEKIIKNEAISPVSKQSITSNSLANLLNIPSNKTKEFNYFSYIFSLDNVRFGNNTYKSNGIFVTKPLSISDVGSIAVKSTQSFLGTGVIKNSIEYEIIKIDRSPKYKETKFSIPYLNQNSVDSERLILIKRDDSSVLYDVGMLRFLPYVPSTWVFGDDDPIVVYKNGIALSTSEWFFAISEENLPTNKSLNWQTGFINLINWDNYTLVPPKFWIKIKNPELNAVYTVSYNIRTSDGHIADDNKTIWLDTNKTISLYKNGKIYIEKDNSDIEVKSDIYLQINIRRNVSTQAISPEVNECILLAANYKNE